ncbi:UDP-2,3-diacetamido-2,3-dideoxy-D-glucuronate 2-epimerase [Jeotgalicoccus saudimassiliensis]|uniref:UDP-2,3-diacetamido-2,3-dideoxy-D-glucuronate 2-epimerase n=1 Tax=Jeotgalicoccus saudimassiliensis TaxID=1461582 RepID=A0A078M2Q3_9STAP|nr:UDP-N-acetylglucosamine 2-epimerase (non-hydrolyzing) [Jeotgalicoccus saudimassiliensis]CEA00470.1 UDP-2,3-diacetamido-2,3-dideoxy-D-glucuronate 2-epimerase [Jeotgalicoccus saudimassiliensis]
MKKLKVMTVVGTRPEIIRLSAVINKLEESDAIEHILVHTGQNYDYELNEVFFNDFNLRKPDYFLNSATGTAVETIGNILIAIDPVLDEVKPDAFLVLGDTNSCLCAIAAKRKKVPIFHMEAGNRCFDQRVPEETNRKIVDHISDMNLTYSAIAREYLLREGLPADRVIKTGSPMKEVITSRLESIEKSSVVKDLGLEKDNYFVVSAHREENISSDKNFSNLVESLNAVADEYDMPIIVSTHPRTQKRIDELKIRFNSHIKTLKPLGFNDYIKLQKSAKAILSDSGTISEETALLGLKSLNIREAHERPEAMEEATVMMVGLEKERVLQGLNILEQDITVNQSVKDYDTDNVSDKVLKIILSYTDYINKNIWRKEY